MPEREVAGEQSGPPPVVFDEVLARLPGSDPGRVNAALAGLVDAWLEYALQVPTGVSPDANVNSGYQVIVEDLLVWRRYLVGVVEAAVRAGASGEELEEERARWRDDQRARGGLSGVEWLLGIDRAEA